VQHIRKALICEGKFCNFGKLQTKKEPPKVAALQFVVFDFLTPQSFAQREVYIS